MNALSPLNESELTELDDFLLSEACDEETLGIDEVHGFLTGLLVVPEALEESRWLEAIWGEPNFANEDQRQRMIDLLRRLHAEIAASLASRRDFEPLVVEVEEQGEPVEAWEGWCQGFVMAMELQPDHWEALPKSEQSLVLPMAQLAVLGEGESDELDMDDAEYQDWVELIPGAVMGLYAYWHTS